MVAVGGDVAHTLRGEGFDASEDGTGRGTPIVVGALLAGQSRGSNRVSGDDTVDKLVPVLSHDASVETLVTTFLHINKGRPAGRKSAHEEMVTAKSHVPTLTTAGAPGAVVVPIDAASITEGDRVARTPSADAKGQISLRDPGTGVGEAGDPSYTLKAQSPHAVAVIPFDTTQITHPVSRARCEPGSPAPTLAKAGHAPAIATSRPSRGGGQAVMHGASVRRLTPTECERLMGFPDGYTALPGAADGPRYAALGNSIAVPCLAWVFRRLAFVDALKGS